jgi:hypothetical protein
MPSWLPLVAYAVLGLIIVAVVCRASVGPDGDLKPGTVGDGVALAFFWPVVVAWGIGWVIYRALRLVVLPGKVRRVQAAKRAAVEARTVDQATAAAAKLAAELDLPFPVDES